MREAGGLRRADRQGAQPLLDDRQRPRPPSSTRPGLQPGIAGHQPGVDGGRPAPGHPQRGPAQRCRDLAASRTGSTTTPSAATPMTAPAPPVLDSIFNPAATQCPNASWNGAFISFCNGFTTDDVDGPRLDARLHRVHPRPHLRMAVRVRSTSPTPTSGARPLDLINERAGRGRGRHRPPSVPDGALLRTTRAGRRSC